MKRNIELIGRRGDAELTAQMLAGDHAAAMRLLRAVADGTADPDPRGHGEAEKVTRASLKHAGLLKGMDEVTELGEKWLAYWEKDGHDPDEMCRKLAEGRLMAPVDYLVETSVRLLIATPGAEDVKYIPKGWDCI